MGKDRVREAIGAGSGFDPNRGDVNQVEIFAPRLPFFSPLDLDTEILSKSAALEDPVATMCLCGFCRARATGPSGNGSREQEAKRGHKQL